MALGCMPSLFHNKANTRPMGRVKYMSMVSSVSLDFNDSRNKVLKLLSIFLFYFYIGCKQPVNEL